MVSEENDIFVEINKKNELDWQNIFVNIKKKHVGLGK